ncbi:uncharacterized protein LOC126661676 [Mercurialis annua]|uniref:uncharacterized protein LOC126661676 n=1 Tax=Mercurialis annua TaxID=3986 RepID=UPI0024AE951F|nr:uncharacterized protein LOC126661676 [Mercurialis annua]
MEHTTSMERENILVNTWNVFKKLHMRKDGSFVDSKSRDIWEKMEAALSLATQPLEDGTIPEIDIDQIYYNVVGGEKKRRVYGLGSQASIFYPQHLPSTTTSQSGSSTNDEVKKMMESLSEKEKAMSEKMQSLTQQQESLNQQQASLRKMQEDCLRLYETLQRDTPPN